jgi:D-alanyl-D-alanine carboxypeptidase
VIIKNLLAALLPLAWFIPGYAQTPDKAKLDQYFDRLSEKNKAMGSLTIAKEGSVLYTRAIGYGLISRTEKKPLTAANTFRIASIGKTYTAVMILQLVDEGKLKLTDTLDKFYPQVPNARNITMLQMLSNRSGIPNVSRGSDSLRNWTNGISKSDMLALAAKGAPEFEPAQDLKDVYFGTMAGHIGRRRAAYTAPALDD